MNEAAGDRGRDAVALIQPWLSTEQVACNRQALLPPSFLPDSFRPKTTCLVSKESCYFSSPKGILAEQALWGCACVQRAAISGELQ